MRLIIMLFCLYFVVSFFFFKQKTAYEMRISDWSSDVCSSDLGAMVERVDAARLRLGVLIDDQVHPALRGHPVAQFVHRPELPCRVDMQQRKEIGRASCRERVCQYV